MAGKSRKRRRAALTKSSKFAIATAACKRRGHSSFGKGSKGERCRKRVAEAIARARPIRADRRKRRA